VKELRNGWYGETPTVGLLTQLALGLLSITLLLHIWLTPTSFGIGLAVVLLTNPRPAVALLCTAMARMQWRRVATGTLMAVPIAGVLAVAANSAAQRDFFRVQEILDDPSAVHVSPTGKGAPE
jgi:hypothetical protein